MAMISIHTRLSAPRLFISSLVNIMHSLVNDLTNDSNSCPYTYNRTLETNLFRAFNPEQEIATKSPLGKLMERSTKFDDQENLTITERIVESGLLRRQLKDNLSSINYLTLQMIYQRSNDIPAALICYADLIKHITRQARLLESQCNPEFATICCLCFAWNRNLFLSKYQRPITNYYPRQSASRKRRLLTEALEEQRQTAMKQASAIIGG